MGNQFLGGHILGGRMLLYCYVFDSNFFGSNVFDGDMIYGYVLGGTVIDQVRNLQWLTWWEHHQWLVISWFDWIGASRPPYLPWNNMNCRSSTLVASKRWYLDANFGTKCYKIRHGVHKCESQWKAMREREEARSQQQQTKTDTDFSFIVFKTCSCIYHIWKDLKMKHSPLVSQTDWLS